MVNKGDMCEYEPILDVKVAVKRINRLINGNELFKADKDALKTIMYHYEAQKFSQKMEENRADKLEADIRHLGVDMRVTQASINNEEVIIGFNIALALMNKHLGREGKDT